MRMRERGAAAVEFALVLLPLCVLLLGIAEGGYLLYLNGSAAGAAREGARVFAITGDAGAGVSAAGSAFTDTTSKIASVSPGPACAPGGSATVTVRYDYGGLTGFFGNSFSAQGTGEMRCGG